MRAETTRAVWNHLWNSLFWSPILIRTDLQCVNVSDLGFALNRRNPTSYGALFSLDALQSSKQTIRNRTNVAQFIPRTFLNTLEKQVSTLSLLCLASFEWFRECFSQCSSDWWFHISEKYEQLCHFIIPFLWLKNDKHLSETTNQS